MTGDAGVWVVWGYSDPYYVKSFHPEGDAGELAARRTAEDYERVSFVPFGKDFDEATK